MLDNSGNNSQSTEKEIPTFQQPMAAYINRLIESSVKHMSQHLIPAICNTFVLHAYSVEQRIACSV